MSYTPPSGGAVNYSFSSANTYTPPSGGSSGYSFSTNPPKVAGSLPSPVFGTPVYPNFAESLPSPVFGGASVRVIYAAEGLPAAEFGVPASTCIAESITDTVFGGANIQMLADSLPAPAFGSPDGRIAYRAEAIPAPAFGTPILQVVAVPITPVQFGVPNAVLAAESLQVSTEFGIPELRPVPAAFSVPAFGTPAVLPCATSLPLPVFAVPTTPQTAESIPTSTVFGVPSAGYAHKAIVSIQSTAFGTPILGGLVQGRILPSIANTRFGTPYGSISAAPGRVDQVCRSGSIRSAAFGVPQTPTDQVCDAESMPVATSFGVPASASDRLCVATSLPTAPFGTPASASDRSFQASSLPSAQFGVPSSGSDQVCVANSIPLSPRFGTPISQSDQIGIAASISAPRFGMPKATGGASPAPVHMAYSIRLGRFEVPRGYTRAAAYMAESIEPGTQFGVPYGCTRHRAFPLFNYTQFGKPQLHRSVAS